MDTQPVAEARPVLVTLPAEIDIANASVIREQIAAAYQPGVRVIIADLSGTTFCDSMGCRALVLAHKRAALDGVELRLLSPCYNVLRVLKVLGLDRVLAIYSNLPDALMP
jgi:anti-sigma B factor antagonist